MFRQNHDFYPPKNHLSTWNHYVRIRTEALFRRWEGGERKPTRYYRDAVVISISVFRIPPPSQLKYATGWQPWSTIVGSREPSSLKTEQILTARSATINIRAYFTTLSCAAVSCRIVYLANNVRLHLQEPPWTVRFVRTVRF